MTKTNIKIFSSALLALLSVQPLAANAQTAETAKHAINTKGTGGNRVIITESKTPKVAIDSGVITVNGRWVARISYNNCPNGTTEYVAADGGAKCWAGPD
jgi:hypothetical protein